VISPAAYNRRTGLCLACPITSQAKSYPFEVAIPPGHAITGVVLVDQLRSLSWVARNAEVRGTAPQPVIGEVRAKLAALIGII
jgi:mRNA interferase MazF